MPPDRAFAAGCWVAQLGCFSDTALCAVLCMVADKCRRLLQKNPNIGVGILLVIFPDGPFVSMLKISPHCYFPILHGSRASLRMLGMACAIGFGEADMWTCVHLCAAFWVSTLRRFESKFFRASRTDGRTSPGQM